VFSYWGLLVHCLSCSYVCSYFGSLLATILLAGGAAVRGEDRGPRPRHTNFKFKNSPWSPTSWKMPSTISLCAVAIGAFAYLLHSSSNILSGFKGDTVLTPIQLQVVVSGFCLSPIPNMLLEQGRMRDDPGDSLKREFNNTGDINEDDYTKDSIYSLLYSLYQAYPTAPHPGGSGTYQFTFNTWGIADTGSPPVPWIRPETEPQRHGMAAYQGLTEFQEVKDLIKRVEKPKFLEIGCGTGAGANLITQCK
jgi:hypothetical protein